MKKILVIVDMQNDFIDGPLGTPEARAIVDNVCAKIREGEWDKIHYTMDTHNDAYLGTQEGTYLPVIHCVEDTHGWQINNKVYKAIFDSVIYEDVSTWDGWTKHTFTSHSLVNWLLPNHENEDNYECTIVGVCTDICVISNALAIKSVYPEMKIVVDASCCAGSTPEKHRMALEVMKSCQIDILNESSEVQCEVIESNMDICEYAELFYNGELTEYQKRILRVYDILPKREDLMILMSRGGKITWVYKDETPINRETLEKCRRIMDGD